MSVFENLNILYARYYLAKKKIQKVLNPSEEDLKYFYEAKEKYYDEMDNFEVFLDAIGEDYFVDGDSSFIGSMVTPISDESKFGVIKEKSKVGWRINWFDKFTLEDKGFSLEENLSNFKIIIQ